MRLAKYLAHAGVASRRAAEEIIARGPRDGRRRGRHRPGARRRRAQRRRGRRRAGRARAGARRSTRSTSRPGVVSTAQDTTAARRSSTSSTPAAAAVPGRPPRRRHDRPDPADQRRRPRQPAHAPALRGAQDLPRARSRTARCASRALRALREGVELDDGRTAPARVRQVEPGVLELTIHEGRKRQVKRMCEAVGHPVRRAAARSRFGPLRLGDLRRGARRRLTAAEVERAAQRGS